MDTLKEYIEKWIFEIFIEDITSYLPKGSSLRSLVKTLGVKNDLRKHDVNMTCNTSQTHFISSTTNNQITSSNTHLHFSETSSRRLI